MQSLNLYKPTPKFPQKTGSAFQFKPSFKTNKEVKTPCIFVEAVPQTKPKPAGRASRDSAFVWAVRENDEWVPHPKRVLMCLDIQDLMQIDAFWTEMDRQKTAFYVLNNLRAFNDKVPTDLPENRIDLTHQLQRNDKQITKGFKIEFPFGIEKDPQISLGSNEGAGHNVVRMFLQSHEQAALRCLVQSTMRRYFSTASPRRTKKDSK